MAKGRRHCTRHPQVSRDWRGSSWRRRSREVRRRYLGRCACCWWRRSCETHHWRSKRPDSKLVPLCTWCHRAVSALDAKPWVPTPVATLAVLVPQWVLNVALVALAATIARWWVFA